MNKAIVFSVLLGLVSPFDLAKAGEFAVINEDVTFTNGSSGFTFWYDTNKGPTNWVSPDNYYDGQFHCRFEVLSQPTVNPSHLSFCIWGKPATPGKSPETASTISAALTGPGSVATFTSVPSSWWKQDGGVNFADRSSFLRWGIPHWGRPGVLLAPKGYSKDPRSWEFWDERTNWLPLRVKATVVAVSKGSTFSGWETYIGSQEKKPETAPAIVAVQFKHFTIANPLPGTAWGTAGIPLADFDGDGDLDCALSRRDAHGFWWYERQSDSTWVQHLINDSSKIPQSLGATALDVDNDGWMDLVFSHVWFKNPGNLRQQPNDAWPVNLFAGVGHDLLGADVDGDGRQDITVFDGKTLIWFNPAQAMASNIVVEGLNHHGGVTPRGGGDLDGDGDLDLVIAGMWFENPGKGVGNWARHSWPHILIPKASYGTSIRSWVVDLDKDGHNDIVYSDCDTGYSHVYWVRNEGKGANWTRSLLPDPPTSHGSVPGTGSFHSLGVADFDRDGDLDVFAGEQEDPDQIGGGKLPMKPKGLKERGVIWINSGSKPALFAPQVIHEDNPGWHDACLGDVDGDGDVDIVTKIWNKDGATYHADYWRNDTVIGKK